MSTTASTTSRTATLIHETPLSTDLVRNYATAYGVLTAYVPDVVRDEVQAWVDRCHQLRRAVHGRGECEQCGQPLGIFPIVDTVPDFVPPHLAPVWCSEKCRDLAGEIHDETVRGI